MSTRVKRMLPELKRVKRMSGREQNKFLKTCSSDFICSICEVIKNILNGNVKLPKRHLSSLCHRKRSLRKLASKATGITAKKRLLQRGGFLGALLTPILSLLGGLLGG